MKTTVFSFSLCVLFSILGLRSPGQEGDSLSNDLSSMSLKDLLDVRIVSVSKSSEFLFDAPLSASVVTRAEIKKAGCNSIMEALRLVPGVIVREQTNGNYDIQIRGEYTTPNALFDGAAATMLVMIDNRPIFNYLKGTTFWETLPVDLNDVEKIEVVRGPAAALYGPNALTGVINIITRQPDKDGLYLVANSRQGSYCSFVNNVSAGYQGNKWSAIASANYQQRNRTQSSYFEPFRNAWFESFDYLVNYLGDTVRDMDIIYPEQNLAMRKYAGNIFVNYTLSDKVQYHLSTGIQHSMVQKVSYENGFSPLTTAASDSRYADLRATIGGLSAQFSYIRGRQVPDHQPNNLYDFNTFDAVVGYDYVNGNFSLKPGLSYRSAVYDDTRYADIGTKQGIFNARGKIITRSSYLRSEYKLWDDKLRLVAGIAGSDFNYPDTTYLSYEFAATYKLNKKNLFRAVFSQAPRSSAIYDTYLDQTMDVYPIGYRKFMMFRYEGNKNLKLLTADLFELGYRGAITPKLYIDAELFYQYSHNYSLSSLNASYVKLNGSDTLVTVPLRPTNLPMAGVQHGMTVSLTWNSKKLQMKPFVTVQRSIVKDYAPYANTPDASPGFLQADPARYNIYSGKGTEVVLKSAPSVFGGFIANCSLAPKINVSLNGYYFSGQTINHASNIIFNDGERGIDHIRSKLIINTNISYQANKELQFFFNAKNLLNNQSREFFNTDDVPAMFFGGLSYEF